MNRMMRPMHTKKPLSEKKGFFVVCEGLDGSGKTSTIKKFLQLNPAPENYFYNKGLKSDGWIGKLAAKKPSSFMFLLDLVYTTHTLIKPALRKNKIVLQDRYDLSVRAYEPAAKQWYNKLLAKIAKPFLLKPDLIIYFTAQLEERIRRLENGEQNPYHRKLVQNPELILKLERGYEEILDNYSGPVIRINSSDKSIEDVVAGFSNALLTKNALSTELSDYTVNL